MASTTWEEQGTEVRVGASERPTLGPLEVASPGFYARWPSASTVHSCMESGAPRLTCSTALRAETVPNDSP